MEKIGLLSLSCFWPKEQVFVGPKTLLLALFGFSSPMSGNRCHQRGRGGVDRQVMAKSLKCFPLFESPSLMTSTFWQQPGALPLIYGYHALTRTWTPNVNMIEKENLWIICLAVHFLEPNLPTGSTIASLLFRLEEMNLRQFPEHFSLPFENADQEPNTYLW